MAGPTRFDDPDLRKQQGKVILARRLAGEPTTQIADSYGMSTNTVARRVKEARRELSLDAAKDRVLDEMVHLALEAFKTLLLQGDYAAARDVLQGTGVLPKNGPPQTELSQTVEMTLDQWREMRSRHDAHRDDEGPAALLAEGNPTIPRAELLPIDGEDDRPPVEGPADPSSAGKGI